MLGKSHNVVPKKMGHSSMAAQNPSWGEHFGSNGGLCLNAYSIEKSIFVASQLHIESGLGKRWTLGKLFIWRDKWKCLESLRKQPNVELSVLTNFLLTVCIKSCQPETIGCSALYLQHFMSIWKVPNGLLSGSCSVSKFNVIVQFLCLSKACGCWLSRLCACMRQHIFFSYCTRRYDAAEIHTTAAFVGGCAAQKVKLVTGQYVPLNNFYFQWHGNHFRDVSFCSEHLQLRHEGKIFVKITFEINYE